jgi:polar amino acid transport system substrate-binding protein
MKWMAIALIAFAIPWAACPAQGLRIYTEISPPLQYLGPDGQLSGFSVDLVREIQKRTGNTDAIESVPWVRGYNELQTRPDVVLFTMARNEERDPLFQWVGPIHELSYQFYVRADFRTAINKLEDAKKLKLIGVYKEDVREQYLLKMGFTNLDRSIDNTVIVKKLMDRRIDAFVSRPDAIDQIMKTAGFRPEDVRGVYTFMKLPGYIAFSKATPPEIVQAWTTALDGILKDGTYERLFRRCFPKQRFVPPSPAP